jgi:hypothetical protein
MAKVPKPRKMPGGRIGRAGRKPRKPRVFPGGKIGGGGKPRTFPGGKIGGDGKPHCTPRKFPGGKIGSPGGPARAAMTPADGGWLCGLNDAYDICAPVAIANHLLAATGRRVSDEDILRLYETVTGGGDHGAPIADSLAAAMSDGIGCCFPRAVRLVPVTRASVRRSGLICGAELSLEHQHRAFWECDHGPGWALHAMVLRGGHVITWGGEIAVSESFLGCHVTELWAVRW